MLDEKEAKRISKFLSYVLRHHPEHIDIELDPNGWADVNTLIEKCNNAGFLLTRESLQYIVDTNSKKRFAVDTGMDRIRASQGHSIDIELALKPAEPPSTLYHGTAESNAESILKSGLVRQQRQHVHLSIDLISAKVVGSRHGRPVIFEVSARKMFAEGHHFYLSDNGVWLIDFVPPEYLTLFK